MIQGTTQTEASYLTAYGASITAGAALGADGKWGFNVAYPQLYGNQHGLAVADFAINGSVLEQVYGCALAGRALNESADAIFFDAGPWDYIFARYYYVMGQGGGVDGQDVLRQAVSHVETVVPLIVQELATHQKPGAKIAGMGMYDPYVSTDAHTSTMPANGTDHDVLNPYLCQINTIVKQSLQEQGLAYADAYTAFNGASGEEDPVAKGYIAPDFAHPSQAGQDALAQAFSNAN